MTINRTFSKFLSTFDGATPPPPTDPAAPPVAAPPAPPGVSAEQLGQIIDLAVARARAAAPPPPPAPPARAPAPSASDAIDQEENPNSVKALRKELAASIARSDAATLGTYRLQAILAVHASGKKLIESLVFGSTKEEIDATIANAVAEYENIQRQVLASVPAPAAAPAPALPPVVQAAPPPAATPPTGIVTQQGQPAPAPQTAAPAPQTAPGFNVPGYIAAPNVPNAPDQTLDSGTFNYLTSAEGVRNGHYAANRQTLMNSLRAGSGGPGGADFAFNPGYQLAPPVPRGMPAQQMQAPQAPAMSSNPYAGVSFPQVRTNQQGILQQQRQAPQQQALNPQQMPPGIAPQPADLDAGASLEGNNLTAAHSAAQNSIAGARARAARMPSTH